VVRTVRLLRVVTVTPELPRDKVGVVAVRASALDCSAAVRVEALVVMAEMARQAVRRAPTR
jgi:hypothetical protein